MAGSCGAFCSFCGKCGRRVTKVFDGGEVPVVPPPGTSLKKFRDQQGSSRGDEKTAQYGENGSDAVKKETAE